MDELAWGFYRRTTLRLACTQKYICYVDNLEIQTF